jgi:hypothetical protein
MSLRKAGITGCPGGYKLFMLMDTIKGTRCMYIYIEHLFVNLFKPSGNFTYDQV